MHPFAYYALSASILVSALGAVALCLLAMKAPAGEEADEAARRRQFVTRLGQTGSAVCFALTAGLIVTAIAVELRGATAALGREPAVADAAVAPGEPEGGGVSVGRTVESEGGRAPSARSVERDEGDSSRRALERLAERGDDLDARLGALDGRVRAAEAALARLETDETRAQAVEAALARLRAIEARVSALERDRSPGDVVARRGADGRSRAPALPAVDMVAPARSRPAVIAPPPSPIMRGPEIAPQTPRRSEPAWDHIVAGRKPSPHTPLRAGPREPDSVTGPAGNPRAAKAVAAAPDSSGGVPPTVDPETTALPKDGPPIEAAPRAPGTVAEPDPDAEALNSLLRFGEDIADAMSRFGRKLRRLFEL
jgi:hypothetical protein